jgi:hypothetical protein
MSNVYTVVGTRMSIAEERPAQIDAAGFEALLTWTEVGECTDLGTWGSTGSTATHQPLATGITEEVKSFISFGSSDITFGRDITDAGQDLLAELAEDETRRNDIVSVKIEHQSGLIQYSEVQVLSFNTSLPGGDSIVNATTTLNRRSRIVSVKPTPTP